MISLHLLLRDHADAVEADLQRFYQLDLADHPRRLSTRRLLVLVRHLPRGEGSAVRSIHGTDGWEWTPDRDILDHLYRFTVRRDTEKHNDPGPHPWHPEHAARARKVKAREPILAAAAERFRRHRRKGN